MYRTADDKGLIIRIEDFEGAARRMAASFAAAGMVSPPWQDLCAGLFAWATEFVTHVATRADFVVGQPLLGFATSGLQAETLRAARDAFTKQSGLDIAVLAKLNREFIDFVKLDKGWNITATSVVARRRAETERWALFSSRGEQMTEWITAPSTQHRPLRLADGWFWVWETEVF